MEGDLLGKKKKKKGGKRTKLAMELIRDPNKRCVSFSKRKKDLFGKCVALSSKLSGEVEVEVAAFIFSQCGRVFSFGHPSLNVVLHRYLGGRHSQTTTGDGKPRSSWDNVSVDEMNVDELRQFKSSLEQLRSRVLAKIIDLGFDGSDDSTDHHLLGFDDLVSLEELGFGNVVNNQHRHCPRECLGDGGLMDIFYEAQRRY